MLHSRGVIQSERIKQVLNFEGMKFGNITPTDMDMVIEYHDKAVVLCEYKLLGCGMPYGQRICLERIARDIEKAGKESVVLLCIHNVKDVYKDIPAKDAFVRAVYYHGKWHKGDEATALQYIERFLRYTDKGA